MDVTVKLKSGLKWSDGQPLTTKDLSFTINAICDPATGAASQTGYSSVASVEDKSDTVEVWHFGPGHDRQALRQQCAADFRHLRVVHRGHGRHARAVARPDQCPAH